MKSKLPLKFFLTVILFVFISESYAACVLNSQVYREGTVIGDWVCKKGSWYKTKG